MITPDYDAAQAAFSYARASARAYPLRTAVDAAAAPLLARIAELEQEVEGLRQFKEDILVAERGLLVANGNRAVAVLEAKVAELEAREALAQRIIDAHADWERRGYKGVPVTFHDLLELWEHGPKEVHLN